MQNVLKNKAVVIAVVGLIAAFALVAFEAHSQAAASSIRVETSAPATTTVSYLSYGTATSTYQFDSPSVASGKVPFTSSLDTQYLYVQFAASSSSSVLNITPQYSNNNVDWYSIAAATSTVNVGGISVLAYPTVYQYSATAAATTSLVFKLPDMAAQHMRVVFGLAAGSAAGAVYNEVVLKENPHSP